MALQISSFFDQAYIVAIGVGTKKGFTDITVMRPYHYNFILCRIDTVLNKIALK